MKKLLATTSILALAASPAFATLALTAGSVNDTAADLDDSVELAEEADLTGADTTTLGFTISTAGVIPPGQNIILEFSISGATFDMDLDGTELTGGGLDGVDGATVQAGTGLDGTTSVTYLLTSDGGLTTGFGTRDFVELQVPITYDGCPSSISASVDRFETEVGGTQIEGGSSVLLDAAVSGDPVDYLECVNAISLTLVDDSTFSDGTLGTGTDTVLDFGQDLEHFALNTGFVAGTLGFSDDVLAGDVESDIGVLQLSIDTTAADDLAVGASPGLVVATDVTDCSFTLSFPEGDDGIVDIESDGPAGSIFDAAGPFAPAADEIDYSCGAAAAADGDAGRLFLTITGTDEIELQRPVCSVSEVDLAANFTDEAFEECEVDDLDPNSLNVGPFDWVGDATKGTRNIFRITGLSALPTLDVEITNTTGGTDVDCTLDLTGKNPDELIINANDLSAACGNWGRGDVLFKFFQDLDNDGNFDIDRLLATGSDNIVSGFGNDDDNAAADASDGDDD